MFRRALENHVEDEFLKLSRNADEFCGKRDFKTGRVSIEETSIALASGQYDLHYIAMPGRLQIDMYNYFRRDYNLTSYKLDYVGSYFIGDNVVKVEHRRETKVHTAGTQFAGQHKTAGGSSVHGGQSAAAGLAAAGFASPSRRSDRLLAGRGSRLGIGRAGCFSAGAEPQRL
jgi:hypothetical protein